MAIATDDPLSRAFIEAHPHDAARVIERLTADEAAAFLEALPREQGAALLPHLATPAAARYLESMNSKRAAGLVAELPANTAVGQLRCMTETARDSVLAALPPRAAKSLRAALNLPEGLVGAAMDPRVETLAEDLGVAEAITIARRARDGLARYMYVLDDHKRLVGVVDVRELLIAEPATAITELCHRNVISVPAHATLEAVRGHGAWETFNVLPVTDRKGVFLGVLRHGALQAGAAPAELRRGDGQGAGEWLFDVAALVWETAAEILVSAIAREHDRR